MEEIRIMWYETLEELLQCPVCFDTSARTTNQCANGHHVCSTCRTQLYSCPMCKSNFISTRNLAVEQISAKLIDIKTSLLDPHHIINKRIIKDKICVATQTEVVPYVSSECQTEPMQQSADYNKNHERLQLVNLPPRVGKGLYPCRIGSCTVELPHGRIIGHIRYHHKDTFYELNSRGMIFEQKWTMEYILNRDFNFALHIKEMGLFFFNISIFEEGDVSARVQIVNCISVSKQFTHTLEIGNGPHRFGYTGLTKSCRVQKESHSEDCLYVRKANMRDILLNNKDSFNCHLIIKRRVPNINKKVEIATPKHITTQLLGFKLS